MSQEIDPYRAYNFKLKIGESEVGHFTECSGLGARVQAIPYRESGDSQVVRHIPGHVEYAEVTLRYGLTDSQDLWEWFMGAVQGRVQRKNVTIVMLGSDKRIARIVFFPKVNRHIPPPVKAPTTPSLLLLS